MGRKLTRLFAAGAFVLIAIQAAAQTSASASSGHELYVSWGYFDPGKSNYADGYQCPPVNWGINTELKKQFFGKLKEITGA